MQKQKKPVQSHNNQKYSWKVLYKDSDYDKASKFKNSYEGELPVKIHRHGDEFRVKEGHLVQKKGEHLE